MKIIIDVSADKRVTRIAVFQDEKIEFISKKSAKDKKLEKIIEESFYAIYHQLPVDPTF